MLRINLLPPHVRERRAVRRYMFASGIMVGALTAGLLFWYTSLNTQLGNWKGTLAKAEEKKTIIVGIRSETDSEKSAAKPILDIAAFFGQANEFGPRIEGLLREVARYTYSDVRILSITPSAGGGAGSGGGDAMAGMMGGTMGGAMGGAMSGAMGGDMGSFGGGGGGGPDVTAVQLDCWTDDYRKMVPFVRNLRRCSLFSSVSEPQYEFSPVEGGGGGAGGQGGQEGFGGFQGAGGAFSGGMGGLGAPQSNAVNGRPTATLVQSRDGVRFLVVCALSKPIKGATVPGTQAPAQDQGMMGMGMLSGGDVGGAAPGGAGTGAPAPGENVGAGDDTGSGDDTGTGGKGLGGLGGRNAGLDEGS